MEDNELLNIWKSYDLKLADTLQVNRELTAEVMKIKAGSFLSGMQPVKIFTITIGIIWVGFLDVILFNIWSYASPFFLVSAGLQVLLTKLAIGIYCYQMILINQAKLSESVFEAQEKIARLKTSTLLVSRLLFLQLPLWTIFYWNSSMLENGNIWLYILQITITGLFTFAAVWLFVNVKYENRDKKWFILLFSGSEWKPLFKAMDVLRQVEKG
ncbi:MAG: hypothetical protein V4687_04135 [Bacteroidota bacterium]